MFGEVLDTFHEARRAGIDGDADAQEVGLALLEVLERRWTEPDDGIWEVRGGRQHFTHSKVMAWVALDRAIAMYADAPHLDPPLERWRQTRDAIRAEVLAHGLDDHGRFVQSFGGTALDASLLMIPLVGFLPADDPRVVATVEAIRDELTHDGFVRRYDPAQTDDGLEGGEGTFLLCTFWLADVLLLQGKTHEAKELFERLLSLRNDVGLLAEMWDPAEGRMLGNFPQAFSHTALASTGIALSRVLAGSEHRAMSRGDGHAPVP